MRKILTIACLSLLCNFAFAQECSKDFDYLIEKIKADYPGYDVKVNEKTLPDLLKLEAKLRGKIKLYPIRAETIFVNILHGLKTDICA